MSQQKVSDELARLDPPVELDRVSVQRIENGKQATGIEAIEGLARIFQTDIDSMLNLTPKEAEGITVIRRLDPRQRRRVIRIALAAEADDEPES